MMARHFVLPVVVVLVAFLRPVASRAAVLTYVTTGHVTQINDSLGLLGFVQVGDPVTYRCAFDTSQEGSHPFPGYSAYTGISSSVQAGTLEFTGGPPIMEIGHPRDSVEMHSALAVSIPGLSPGTSIQMVLYDQVESNALTDTALPTVPYDLNPFASTWHQITFFAPPPVPGQSGIGLWIGATVDSFQVVPEPGALRLLAVGGAVVIRRRSRVSAAAKEGAILAGPGEPRCDELMAV
jgi:hypothetical protein